MREDVTGTRKIRVMRFSRLSFKLFGVYLALNLAVAVAYVTVVANWQRAEVMKQVEDRLRGTPTAVG